MSGPKIFATIRKVDEEKRMVFGRIAKQEIDKSGEMLDYAKSKPYFKAWSDELSNDTGGKSLGNVRAMHGKVAAGVLKAIDFNDADMAIDVGAHIVDDQEWKKCLAGVYTGFSIGGAYVGEKKAEKMDGRDVLVYTAKPNEVSLVDRPCIPSAKFFEVQKADGATEQVEFKFPLREEMLKACGIPDGDGITDEELLQKYEALPEGGSEDDAPATYEVRGSDEDVADLAKVLNDNKLDLGSVNKFVTDILARGEGLVLPVTAPTAEVDPELLKVEDKNALRKGVYGCASFSQVLSSLISLKQSAEYEAFAEGEPPEMAKRISALIAMTGEIFKAMIDEAVAENYAGTEAPAPMVTLAERCGELQKGLEEDSYLTLLKLGARNSKNDAERISKVHALSVELGATCEAQKMEKTEPAGDLQKMISDAVAPLNKALADATAKIEKLEAQPAAATIRLRAVAKGEDFVPDPQTPALQPAPVVDASGTEHQPATLIKALHQTGGVPLMKN